MPAIDELLSEYIRMRENGLDSNEALRTLRHYIEALATEQREELAQLLRGWENKLISAEALQADSKREKTAQEETMIACPKCKRPNRVRDMFCYACGHLLEGLKRSDTLIFSNSNEETRNDEYFGSESVLILEIPKSDFLIEVRPQEHPKELIIGRKSEGQLIQPDIDLTTAQGAALGVSRLHLALTYDETLETIKINDLGSANGTTVNGQKIHPSEYRILHNKDELRLGKLILLVRYEHPAEDMD